MKAVVFAYHDVGVRCLATVLASGLEVPLVVTHADRPGENIWFGSVARLAQAHGLRILTPEDPNERTVVEAVRAIGPDFLFSFYYRRMLGPELLTFATRGALNLHGSLLPKYRGRTPVNWAILRGETETGATLHHMSVKPDAGPIVDQYAVPILPDDTALDVFRKVTCAAELILNRSLPALIAGTATAREQDLSQGSYFGGRRPADGIIDWRQPARQIHDLVRAVAPPFPGAWTDMDGRPMMISRTRIDSAAAPGLAPASLFADHGQLFVATSDGKRLQILELQYDGRTLRPEEVAQRLGGSIALLGTSATTLDAALCTT